MEIASNDYDDNFLHAVILKTNLNKFIEQLPDGINTFVGDRGVNLSGGQRQRISIARSLYHKREILVLDESTSSLDFKTEKNVIEQIREFQKYILLDGVILTKMDGTAKGGIAIPIMKELKLPIYFLGVGEGINDLIPFNLNSYLYSLVGLDKENNE